MSEKLKRLQFIKKNAPIKFEEALFTGSLVPTAEEMNILYNLNKKKRRQ